jgi:Xaa-Pro aminopeptidase
VPISCPFPQFIKEHTAVTPPRFPAFGKEEHQERVARAREKLGAAGFDGCVCVGPDLLNYLGGFDCCSYFSPQALIFSVKGDAEPTLFVRNADTPHVAETSWLSDIRTYQLNGEDPVEIIAGIVRELGFGSGRIAVDLGAYACTGRYALKLMESLAPATVEDGTDLLNTLQFVKSEAEMRHIRQAGRYADIGVEAARGALRVGMTEIQLIGEIEAAMREAGNEYPALPGLCASGARGPGMHSTPMPKQIEAGELVHVEFPGVSYRYHAVAILSLAAGEPSPLAHQLYDLGNETLQAALDACVPGAPIAEMERASIEPLKKAGREDAYMVMFGTGLGVAYPPVWVGALTINRWSDKVLEPGMVFYAHSCLQFMDEGIGILQGGTYHVTDRGAEPICGAGICDLVVV